MNTIRLGTIAALTLLVVAACSGAEADTSRCEDAPAGLLTRIADGGVPVELDPYDGAVVRSDDFDDVHMVAMRFGPADDLLTGVWAVGGDLDAPSQILAVDGFAHEFTQWPYGPDTAFEVTQSDDGFDDARACV